MRQKEMDQDAIGELRAGVHFALSQRPGELRRPND